MQEELVVLGSDHAGLSLKKICMQYLQSKGINHEDVGAFSAESCDYPIYAAKACKRVLETNALGLLICGSGIGMSMSANRFHAIRAALCSNEYMAAMARKHNDANVLCLGARILGEDLALAILENFLRSDFEGGRHQRRVELIDNITGAAKD